MKPFCESVNLHMVCNFFVIHSLLPRTRGIVAAHVLTLSLYRNTERESFRCLIPYSVERKPSWEAKSSSATKFPAFYGTRKFITAYTRSRECYLFIFWARSSQYIPTSLFLKIHFNIILPPTPGSFKLFSSRTFPHWNSVCTSPLLHTCYMPCPFQPSGFDQLNDIWWWVQSIKLLFM